LRGSGGAPCRALATEPERTVEAARAELLAGGAGAQAVRRGSRISWLSPMLPPSPRRRGARQSVQDCHAQSLRRDSIRVNGVVTGRVQAVQAREEARRGLVQTSRRAE